MKLHLLNSYPKFKVTTDAQGEPVLDPQTGKAKGKLVKRFRYALLDATPAEVALYKKFKTQDGKNYYRESKEIIEGKKRPLWHGEHIGREVTLRSYVRTDGKIGFSADTTEVDELMAMAEKFPDMADTLHAKVVNLQLTGKRIILDDENQDDEEQEETTLADETSGDDNTDESGD
jgi:hypothetical protein